MPRNLQRARAPEAPVEDAYQFLWAVSYSDLLMVIIAFLIIFYGFASLEGQSTTQKIAQVLKADLGATELDKRNESQSGENQKAGIVVQPLEALSKEMSAKEVQMANDERGIVIDLPANIYASAKFTVDDRVRLELEKVLKVVKPYSADVALTFIGHADETPFLKIGKNLVDSNLILSNLRATKAVEFAVKMGFNPRWVSAQGVAEYERNSRSLSLRLIERRTQ